MLKVTPRGLIEQAWDRRRTESAATFQSWVCSQVSESSCRSMRAAPAGLCVLPVRWTSVPLA